MNMEGRRYSFPQTSLANIRRTSSVSDIRHKDKKRVITFTGEAAGWLASEVLGDVKGRLKNSELPAGYQIKSSGKDEEQKKAEAFLKNAFVITLLLVFLILVSEFNSIRVPFVIMLSVLLSLIGVMIGLMVARLLFSVNMTGVAIIFGLTIATFLTLVIVPAFYALLESWAQKITTLVRRVFAAKTDADVVVEKPR